MADLPVIDIGPYREPEELLADVEAACRDIGFMYVTGHGIAGELVVSVRAALVAYFGQPLAAKLRDRILRGNYRGYIPEGFFTPNTGGGAPDRYEGYKLHTEIADGDPIIAACDLYGPNRWPSHPPHFAAVLTRYRAACDAVAGRLLAVIARILRVDVDAFLSCFEQPLTNMTLLHYPPQAPDAEGFGIHPHKDTDALTILAPDPVGGLMVRARGGGGWSEVRAPGDALVVNIGDLLELWSGGYFVSTPHKVVNTSGRERYSFPYFVVPRYDTVVRPLREPVAGFHRESVHVGDVSREVWRTNWPDALPAGDRYDLGTLAD